MRWCDFSKFKNLEYQAAISNRRFQVNKNSSGRSVLIPPLTSLSTRAAWFCTVRVGQRRSRLWSIQGSVEQLSPSTLLNCKNDQELLVSDPVESSLLPCLWSTGCPFGTPVVHVTACYPNEMWQLPTEAPERLADSWHGTFPLLLF